jgi:phosphate transport system permease protein
VDFSTLAAVTSWASRRYRLEPGGRQRPGPPGRTGDRALFAICGLASLLAVATLAGIAYQVIHHATPAISRFGLGFIGHTTWAPNFRIFGAGALLYGTVVSSLVALLIATPLGIAIALYLAMIAPPAVRAFVGPLIEMLAAIPSIILGFWGVIVFAPFIQKHVEPFLHGVLGFIPLFGPPQTTGLSLFTAGLVLTVMVLPIIASLSRDLFLTVPQELKDGAAALGATRWETIRGVVLPTTAPGVAAATLLGLGRALGEAIAVLLVAGDLVQIHFSLFFSGSTMASLIATQFPAPVNTLHVAAMFYVALVLLAIGLITSVLARVIAGRFDVNRTLAR